MATTEGPKIESVQVNRLAQYLYEEISAQPNIRLDMMMSGKPEMVDALTDALARIGVEVTDESRAERQDDHVARLARIVSEITLGMQCKVRIGQDPGTRRAFLQIQCWRMDVITKVEGYGYGGKAYPSEHATDSEIIQMIFGLYKGYWEHEARETFEWRGRRPFGPHISTEALWEVARRVDVRSAKHVDDRPESGR